MSKKSQQLFLQWRGIEMDILFHSNFSKAYEEITGEVLFHIELRAKQPLPITETGYRSIYVTFSELEKYKHCILLIEGMLEEAAASPKWKSYTQSQSQLSLF